MIEVKLVDVKKIFDKVIEKMEEEKVSSIKLETDNYWIITADEWDSFSREIEPVVGSLTDDWESLRKTFESDQPFTYVDFDRLASILRAISQARNPI